MRYRLRTLLIALAIAPPLLAVGWFMFQNVARQRAARLGIFYSAVAEFDELRADDSALDRWVRAYPRMEGGRVKRSGSCIEVEWFSYDDLGDRPLSDLRAQFDRLGYKGLKRFEPYGELPSTDDPP